MSGCGDPCTTVIDGVPAGSSSAADPLLLSIGTTVAITDATFGDLFAGQAAPEPASAIVPPMTRGGVHWCVWGTWSNTSGVNRTYEYQINFGGVTLYQAISQNMASNATERPWLYMGSIQRKGAASAWFGAMPMSSTSVGGTVIGIGPFNVVGTNLGPCVPHANAAADVGGLDWTVSQALVFNVRWSAAVAGLSYAISGGWVQTYGS